MHTASDQGLQDLLRGFFQNVDAANWPGMMACVHDQIEYDRPGYETLKGKHAYLDFYMHRRRIAHGEHRLVDVMIDGDMAVCFGVFEGVSRTGERLKAEFADRYRFEDGKILGRTTYFYAPLV